MEAIPSVVNPDVPHPLTTSKGVFAESVLNMGVILYVTSPVVPRPLTT